MGMENARNIRPRHAVNEDISSILAVLTHLLQSCMQTCLMIRKQCEKIGSGSFQSSKSWFKILGTLFQILRSWFQITASMFKFMAWRLCWCGSIGWCNTSTMIHSRKLPLLLLLDCYRNSDTGGWYNITWRWYTWLTWPKCCCSWYAMSFLQYDTSSHQLLLSASVYVGTYRFNNSLAHLFNMCIISLSSCADKIVNSIPDIDTCHWCCAMNAFPLDIVGNFDPSMLFCAVWCTKRIDS